MNNEDGVTVTVGVVIEGGGDMFTPLVHAAIQRLAVATKLNAAYRPTFVIIHLMFHFALLFWLKENIMNKQRLLSFSHSVQSQS